MGYEEEDILGRGEFGALTARAGVGKTSFLVQLALDKMLRGRNVLHISIDEPVEKVCLCYEDRITSYNVCYTKLLRHNTTAKDSCLA